MCASAVNFAHCTSANTRDLSSVRPYCATKLSPKLGSSSASCEWSLLHFPLNQYSFSKILLFFSSKMTYLTSLLRDSTPWWVQEGRPSLYKSAWCTCEPVCPKTLTVRASQNCHTEQSCREIAFRGRQENAEPRLASLARQRPRRDLYCGNHRLLEGSTASLYLLYQ